MPEVQEVFRMSTQKVKPDPGALERQHTRQRRRSAGRKYGAIAVAAAIGLIAVVLILVSRPASDTAPAPAGDPTTPLDLPSPKAPTEEGAALSVATEFVQAVGAFDAETAMTHLTDDAELSEGLAPGQLPLLISLYEAQGLRQILDACESTVISSRVTQVRCAYDFHMIRSDEIGRGPYAGSYWDITVIDGEITFASQNWEIGRFSPEMWEPFADWVSATHPDDFDAMYTGGGTNFRISEESVRLWERNTERYVEAVLAGKAE